MEADKETKSNDQSCGICSWRPKCLQIFAGPKSFCFLLCLILFCQTMAAGGLLSASLRDIEKQFGFTSKQSGFILISNDIAALLVVPLVSFLGEKGNKPKWIGYGTLLCGIGAFGCALPKFLIAKYIPVGSNALSAHGLPCVISNTTINYCVNEGATTSNGLYLFVFAMGQMFLGLGAAPLLTLGVSYIDENVDPKQSPFYMGFIYAATFTGGSAGLVIAGFFLRTFVELDLPSGVNLTVDDQAWIGAWWLGFVGMSIFLAVLSPFVFMFPRKLPGSSLKRKEAIEKGEIKGNDERIEVDFKGFLNATKYLIKNKIYILALIGVTSTTVIGAGFGSAFPKFLVLKFGASTDLAGIAAGIAVLPAVLIGIMIGSVIMKKLPVKESVSAAVKLCTFFSFMLAVFSGVFMIPGCKEPNIVGAVLPYHNSTGQLSLNAACNSECNCDRSAYNPGCGIDGKTYFSPCYAGCQGKVDHRVYANCSCIPDVTNTGKIRKHLFSGQCDRKCKNLYVFLALVCLFAVVAFLKATPHKMIILREVPENQRSYALGIQLLVVRLLGFIPSPVIIGAVIDSNCILWSETSCGKRGSCLAYQNYQFSINMAVFNAACAGVSLLSYGLAWYFHKRAVAKRTSKLPKDVIASNDTISTVL